MTGWLVALSILLAAVPGPRGAAWAQALVVDLSTTLVAIDTGFTGSEVVLFGATAGEGEVAVVVRGPPTDVTVRERKSFGGIWVNWRSATFAGIPGYYDVAASRVLGELAPPAVLARHQIGLDNLQLQPLETEYDPPTVEAFRAALIRNLQGQALYPSQVHEAVIMGNRLFRVALTFPADVPNGLYSIDTYLIRDGAVVAAAKNSLVISKVGFSYRLVEFANQQAAAYGILAVLAAVGFGWAGAFALRQR